MSARVTLEELKQLDARNICVIKPSALGDVVQTLPLLPVLRERFPQAKISWVINRSLANLLELHPDIDELIRFDRHGERSSWMQTLRDLRQRQFDLVFDMQGLLRTAVMSMTTRAPVRVGLETAREGARFACHVTIPDSGKLVPAHLRVSRVADALGMGHLRPESRVAVTAEDQEFARERIAAAGAPVLAVHPGARWITKRWPVERFASIACKAMRRYGFATMLLGSADEAPVCGHVEQLVRRFIPHGKLFNFAGETSLKQLAAILAGAHVVLTNDSGPMHLGAAMGTPVVGIFTCTSPVRSGPPGEQHQLVSTNLSCAASYRRRCPFRGNGHLACMEELDVERVWQAFVRVMEKNYDKVRAA